MAAMRRLVATLLLALPLACLGLGGDFRLTDHHGQPFALSDARGQVVVMAFGFTSCPDVCPVMLATVTAALTSLGARAADVQPLFISLDPERDTAERLREYVTWFHPRILGLRGSPEALERVTSQYRARYRFVGKDREGTSDYTLDHTSSIYVVGADGRLVGMVPHGVPASVLADTIDRALDDAGSIQPEE
jgi:cytochrome oxidase Cu insertion factor (SCO1/SenC/PrrC family)